MLQLPIFNDGAVDLCKNDVNRRDGHRYVASSIWDEERMRDSNRVLTTLHATHILKRVI